MNKPIDILIIGGGPTGSGTGTFLAREGFHVQILEKDRFPREHVGESMLPYCYELFEQLGVLEEMKTRFTRKPGVTFCSANGAHQSHWCFDKVLEGPASLSFHARRSEFDEMMLNNARKEGVTVLEGIKVLEATTNPAGEGVRVRAMDDQGAEMTFEARFLIDASGQDCFLTRKMGTQKRFENLNIRLALSSHWKGAHLTESLKNGNVTIIHFGGEKLGWIWLIPLAEDRLSIGLALNMTYANEQRKILMEKHGARDWQRIFYLQELNESSVVADIIRDAEMTWDVVSNGDFSYYADVKFGPSFAIVGDAAAFLDPIFSSGIYLGLKAASLVAPGVVTWLRTGNIRELEDAYKLMQAGYDVVEDLILAFYEPDTINFTELSGSDAYSHDRFEAAYSVLHLLLAGDFYSDAERYRKAIAALRDSSMIQKFRALKMHDDPKYLKTLCVPPNMKGAEA